MDVTEDRRHSLAIFERKVLGNMYGACEDVNTGEWKIRKKWGTKRFVSKSKYCGRHYQETSHLGGTRMA